MLLFWAFVPCGLIDRYQRSGETLSPSAAQQIPLSWRNILSPSSGLIYISAYMVSQLRTTLTAVRI
jgi:hypothetical protein